MINEFYFTNNFLLKYRGFYRSRTTRDFLAARLYVLMYVSLEK